MVSIPLLLAACVDLEYHEDGDDSPRDEIAIRDDGTLNGAEPALKGGCVADCADGSTVSVSCGTSGSCEFQDQVCANSTELTPGFASCSSTGEIAYCDTSATVPDVQVYAGGQSQTNPIGNILVCKNTDYMSLFVTNNNDLLLNNNVTPNNLVWTTSSNDVSLTANGLNASAELLAHGFYYISVWHYDTCAVSPRRSVWVYSNWEECGPGSPLCVTPQFCLHHADCCDGEICDLLTGQCFIEEE